MITEPMKYPILAALLLGACSNIQTIEACDQLSPDWQPQRCERDAVARTERPSPEKPTVDKPEPEKPATSKPEPEKPADGDEPDSETDPSGYKEWKDRQEVADD